MASCLGHARSATVVGASVAVDGTHRKPHSDTIYGGKLARKATVWAKAPLKIHAHDSPGHVYRCWVHHSTRRNVAGKATGLHRKTQARLSYPGTRVVRNAWHDRHLQRKLKQQQTAMMKLSAYACVSKRFCLGSWICKTGNRQRDTFLLICWWTVVVSTTSWHALRPLVLA